MTTAKRFIALRKHYGQFEIYSQPINPKTGKAWQADTLKDVFDNAGKALVKFNVWAEGDKLMARSYWLDHSTAQYAALLQELGLSSLIETVEAYEQKNGSY